MLAQVSQGGSGVFILGDHQDLTGASPEHPAVGDLLLLPAAGDLASSRGAELVDLQRSLPTSAIL